MDLLEKVLAGEPCLAYSGLPNPYYMGVCGAWHNNGRTALAMYLPKHFSTDDENLATRLIGAHPFAVLMSLAVEPQISHLLLLLIDDGSEHGRIIGHVAKANPHGGTFDGQTQAVAVFSGPHAYVSPSWYTTPAMVPTWNYAAVHAHGRPVAADDARAEQILRLLVAQFESDTTGNWSLDGLPDGHLARQLKGIVAFDMPIERIETKVKMSQNRSQADIAGAVAALSASTDQDERATASMMVALNRG